MWLKGNLPAYNGKSQWSCRSPVVEGRGVLLIAEVSKYLVLWSSGVNKRRRLVFRAAFQEAFEDNSRKVHDRYYYIPDDTRQPGVFLVAEVSDFFVLWSSGELKNINVQGNF